MTIQPNLLRMIQLAEEFFETKNDPSQISVDESALECLRKLHPSTIGEETSEDGPIAWTLVIPTTEETMRRFLACEISERELLERTHADDHSEAIYLCSALVLPEYRGKGLAKHLIRRSIENIRKAHPIQSLYCWTFSVEGRRLAQSVARTVGLPLVERSH
jgi:GNAT superfamily N-acetyltransferase